MRCWMSSGVRNVLSLNAANSPAEKRKQHEVFELASRMAETLYSMPPAQRLGHIEEIVQLARSGGCSRVRQILTMPALIRPHPDKHHLFPRGCRSYCTISQAADRYCRISPWNAGVADVVRGKVPEPPTGEVTLGVLQRLEAENGLGSHISEAISLYADLRSPPLPLQGMRRG